MRIKCIAVMALLCLVASPAFSQALLIDDVDGTWQYEGVTYIEPGLDVVYHLRIINDTGDDIGGMTSGFEVYGPESFEPVAANFVHDMGAYFDLVCGIDEFSVDGIGADTVGFYGSVMFNPGVPDGFDGIFMTITTRVGANQEGSRLCLDSAYFPPSGLWKWGSLFFPAWNGPLCYEVMARPQEPIVITNCVATYTGDHCAIATYDFNADNPAGGPLTWEKISGIGEVDPTTGVWTYVPSLADVTDLGDQIEVRACNDGNCSEICHMHVFFTNEAPVFTGGLGDYTVTAGEIGQAVLIADPVDCDAVDFMVVEVDPIPGGIYEIDGNTLLFHSVAPDDAGEIFEFNVVATDGHRDDTGVVSFEVTTTEPYEVRIEKVHDAYQGMPHVVDVTLNAGKEKLAGFDLLISYDATALSFLRAIEGTVYDCGWEYFTYRPGPFGGCGVGCPGGLVRVVGIAETNNGAHHPDFDCYFDLAKPFTLFMLEFLVTDDRTFECMHVPIGFFWMDCTDNSLAYHTQDDPLAAVQGVSRFIYQHGREPMIEISDPTTGFPTPTGVQEECLAGGGPGKPAPVQFVDFINGGVDIVCADSIDDRGDVNMNGEPNEIADAVLFSNYFIFGLSVFTVNMAGQITATDTNADGLTLTVADLVYLTRTILGDVEPYGKLTPVTAHLSMEHNELSVDRPMGAAYVVASGDVTPVLLAEQMDIRYNFDGSQTHILVSSLAPGAEFDGAFLRLDAPIVSVELATYEGAVVHAKPIPATFALGQNYPNPFNPTTRIAFSLPRSSEYVLTVHNISGQTVGRFKGLAEAGRTVVEWDASDRASGVYFYRLQSDGRSLTRKMLLLK